MLKKSIGLGVAALALGTFGILGNGCSSTSTSAGPGTDAQAASDGKKPSEGGSGDSSTVPACYTEGDALTLTQAFSGPVAGQNKCTSDQITGFFTACFSPDDGGTDAGGICQAFIDANDACVSCINGPTAADAGTGGPSPIILPVSASSNFVTLNVAGCVAAISAGDATCKQTYEDLSFCSNTACSSCATADAQACVDYASTDATSICASTDVVDSTCQAAIAAVSTTDQQTKCGVGTSDFQTQYGIIANTICGP